MAHAERSGERIIVETRWNERELVKQIPGVRWDPTAKHWHMSLTWDGCIMLRGVFGDDLSVGDKLSKWAWKKLETINRLMTLRTQTAPAAQREGEEWPRPGHVPGLYPFQQVGASFLKEAEEALLGDEMGTGKTIQVLAALTELPAVVICPNSVKTNWEKETHTWRPDVHPYVVVGGAVQRRKIISEAMNDPRALIIVNYEALRVLTRLAPYGSTRLRRCRVCDKKNGEETLKASQCQVHPKELNHIDFRTVIIDEAHRIKEPKSQQTRAVWAVSHQPSVRFRWALTGTPLANHPGDLWAILHAISPKAFPTKTNYVDRYCLQSWNAFGGLDIVGVNAANREEFFKLLDPRFRRMPKELVLSQLPPKLRTTRWVELTPAQRKMYNEFEKSLTVTTPTGVIMITGEAGEMIARLRQMQIASASITAGPTSNSAILLEPSPKIDELMNILEDIGDKPVVVCAESRQLIDLAAARLKKANVSHGLITGPVPEYERHRTLAEFQAGKLRVLLFTVKAGGVGLTMTAADTIIFLQRSWSMIDNKQAEDRVHRIGSEIHESIHVIDIVARDTVEEKQIASLTEKFMRLQEIARDRIMIAAAESTGWSPATKALDDEEELILNSEL